MRNSKVKGFTLIELIVVIAIIGILAAILVPSMLGYVRNARISQANANAKQVHTAVSSALTQLGISNVALAAEDANTAYRIDFGAAANGEITATFTPALPSGAGALSADQVNDKMDLISYLGENFTGAGRAYFAPSTYSVSLALYGANADIINTAVGAHAVTRANGVYTNAFGELAQKDDAKNGNLYGVYPQGTDATQAAGGNT